MAESPSRPFQIDGRDEKMPSPKYLPGQRSLFEAEAAVEPRGELFYTGKDLPGAGETNQVILWDVA